MRTVLRAWLPALVALVLFAASADAADKIRVVATITDLKALTDVVGGDLVDVDALARGNQNAHDLEVRPSLMVKVRRADLLVMNGLELDQWAEVVIQGANNPKVPTTRVDRSMGDVHPVGNPHYTLDPGMAPAITANILEGLVRVAPQHRAAFERNRQAFLGRLEGAMAGWTTMMAPFKGARVIVDHNMWPYFLTRFGLLQAYSIEERPGIPPTPGHLTKLIASMKEEHIKVILSAPWSDQKLAERIAQEAGGKVVSMASAVGAVKGADDYLGTIDYNVKAVAQA